jgi:hypothetical protein
MPIVSFLISSAQRKLTIIHTLVIHHYERKLTNIQRNDIVKNNISSVLFVFASLVLFRFTAYDYLFSVLRLFFNIAGQKYLPNVTLQKKNIQSTRGPADEAKTS